MTDDTTHVAQRRIKTSHPFDVGYWARKFGISEAELKLAVLKVGNDADAVIAYLRRVPKHAGHW